jgi:hypothetical protein
MKALAELVVQYLAGVTGLAVTRGSRIPARLPQFLTRQYALYEIKVEKRRFLGIFLEGDDLRPAAFEKHLPRLLSAAGDVEGYCLVARRLPSYVRARLVERRIPFVVPGRQLYWPELGMVFEAGRQYRIRRKVKAVKPATQTVLLLALNGEMAEAVTPKDLGARLGYTPMTMTRALDEIEATGLGEVARKGRERLLTFPEDRLGLWQAALPYLQSPARHSYRVKEEALPAAHRFVASETALAARTMLTEPREPVYATGREGWKAIRDGVQEIPVQDTGTCLLQIWRYDPELFARDGYVDPFSLYLSLRNEPDERVQSALQQMMEDQKW